MSVHILDTCHLGRAGVIAVTALETDDGVVLFDTGPESTFANVSTELAKIGFSHKDVRHIFLSHIHFDHAGAAWRFAETKDIKIYVHPRGARHLADPTRLVQSATRIFGSEMERRWGRVAAVPADRMRVLEDMESVKVSPFEIRALATPGHASHHHVYHWNDNVFGGDVAGVRIGQGPPIPPFVPPELDVNAWVESIAKIRALGSKRIYLPHFGKVEEAVAAHLDRLEERVIRWSNWYREKIHAGASEQQLASDFMAMEHDELRKEGATDEDVADYEAADPSYMAVPAAVRYWQKFDLERA